MFSQRWSTFTVLSLALTVAFSAFYGGRISNRPVSSKDATQMPEKQDPPMIVREPAEAINSDKQPKIENPQERWNKLSAQPGTPVVENELSALIEEMAGHDPQRAISLATTQTNLRLRAALLRAALKGWGETNPEAAAEWAQSETVMDQAQAVNALLQGAIHDPDKAISVTTALIQKDSGRATEFGSDLISALTEGGQFDRAANFATSGVENCRDDWMLAAYSRWAEFQPQAAVANATLIADSSLRDTAFNAIIAGWSPTDPKGMIEFAQNNLMPEQQKSALTEAIGFWADSDPVAAATWINQNQSGAAADTGIAEIALSPQLSQKPEVAATWAESIFNPQLRTETLTTLLQKWAAIDHSSVEKYIENSSALAPEERSVFRANLNPQSEP